eukprot:m.104341 g.104341  ORF g.104341 m.104341 type:complete len:215 (+) comp51591_c0_seq2:60-704(+)
MTERPPSKIIIIGDGGCGKSCLLQRFVNNKFDSKYLMTMGVDFLQKMLKVRGEEMQLQLWDIAGQDRFEALNRTYFKGAVAAVIVFDITRRKTFDKVLKWKAEVDSKVFLGPDEPVPCVLLANKCDLKTPAVSSKEIHDLCTKLGFIGWLETSAKDGTNIDQAFTVVCEAIQDRTSGRRAIAEEEDGSKQDSFVLVRARAPVLQGPAPRKSGWC